MEPNMTIGIIGSGNIGQAIAKRLSSARMLPAAALASEPRTDGGRRVLFISGNDATAKREVSLLIDRLGFVAIDLGDLEIGRHLQQFPGGPLAGVNLVKFT
jgi:predicted dinucleotide-binding enzyme